MKIKDMGVPDKYGQRLWDIAEGRIRLVLNERGVRLGKEKMDEYVESVHDRVIRFLDGSETEERLLEIMRDAMDEEYAWETFRVAISAYRPEWKRKERPLMLDFEYPTISDMRSDVSGLRCGNCNERLFPGDRPYPHRCMICGDVTRGFHQCPDGDINNGAPHNGPVLCRNCAPDWIPDYMPPEYVDWDRVGDRIDFMSKSPYGGRCARCSMRLFDAMEHEYPQVCMVCGSGTSGYHRCSTSDAENGVPENGPVICRSCIRRHRTVEDYYSAEDEDDREYNSLNHMSRTNIVERCTYGCAQLLYHGVYPHVCYNCGGRTDGYHMCGDGPVFGIVGDGPVICHDCVRDHWDSIMGECIGGGVGGLGDQIRP